MAKPCGCGSTKTIDPPQKQETPSIKVGTCNRCGMCCLGCETLTLTFVRGPTSMEIHAECRKYQDRSKDCQDYPEKNGDIFPCCGYRFIDEQGKDLTKYRDTEKIPCLIKFKGPLYGLLVIKREET